METESLTGPQAVSKTTKCTLTQEPRPSPTVVHFKVSTQGITLTDNQRRYKHTQPSKTIYIIPQLNLYHSPSIFLASFFKKEIKVIYFRRSSKLQAFMAHIQGINHKVKTLLSVQRRAHNADKHRIHIPNLYLFLFLLYRLFFRRHYPIHSVTFSSVDPLDQR